MKAAYVYEKERMEIRDMPMPEISGGEALIEIIYAGVCGSDITMYRAEHPTAKPPVVLGHEIFGIVREVCPSNGSTIGAPFDIRVGDRVTAEPLVYCGVCEACRQGFGNVCGKLRLIGIHLDGAYSQFVKAGIDKLVKIESGIPDKLGALAEPFAVAYHLCMRANLHGGEDALIIGAGPIGNTVAVMARAFGANVTVSEPNEARRATAAALGFPTHDPTCGDEPGLLEATGGVGFDVVFEASGSKAGILSTTRLCKIHGVIVPLALAGAPVEFILGQVSFKEITVVGSRVYPFQHFKRGVEMLEKLYMSGTELNPLVSDTLPLCDAQKAVDMMISGKNACKILLDARA